MDYKKKYEQAISRMNKWVEGSEITDPKEVAEFVFPELKESEDDKIRKAIFKALSKKDARDVLLANGIQVSDALSWLEKQGDKPHEEKVDEAMREIEEKAKAFSDKHKGETSDEILAQMRGEQIVRKADIERFGPLSKYVRPYLG